MTNVLMPLGDSLVVESAPPHGSVWRLRLYSMLIARGYSVHLVGSTVTGDFPEPHNEGHSGFTLAQLTAGVPGWLAANPADHILLLAGTAAALEDEPDLPTRYQALLQQLWTTAPGTGVIASTIPHPNPALVAASRVAAAAALNAALPGIAAQQSAEGQLIRLVDAAGSLPLGTLGIDGAHPAAVGYAMIADAFLPTLLGVLPPPAVGAPNGLVSPRPKVCVERHPLGGGKLGVTIRALGHGNTLQACTMDAALNVAVYDWPGVTAGDVSTSFTMETLAAGQMTYLALTATDTQGLWPLSISGGPNEF
jgi:hypothetical protein